MIRYLFFIVICCAGLSCRENEQTGKMTEAGISKKIRLMTLDPGHFHAALVQKTMYPQVDSTIYVYAPEGPEVRDFLAKMEQYNSRSVDPTGWRVITRLGDDYLERMLTEKPGNVMVVAGKNSKKIDYILEAVKAGLNVYADKPLVIDAEGFQKLQQAFKVAAENNVLIYDIMTERFESTTMMQKLFSGLPDVFGDLVDGSPDEPAISKESVHHFFKYVSGNPLVRPPWFFDVDQEGEGIVDVTTHLVDLVQWEAFPEQIIDSSQVQMIAARRWPTVLTKEEFTKVTGLPDYPEYLRKDLLDNGLNVYSNGEMTYRIRGKYAKVSVVWHYQAPEGAGDTHYSVMRGTLSDLVIRQGEAENYKPVLYIIPTEKNDLSAAIKNALADVVAGQFPGTTAVALADGSWRIDIPDDLKVGHEAHFGQVTQNYLRFLEEGLPSWEVPNMITKYYTTMEALKMAKRN